MPGDNDDGSVGDHLFEYVDFRSCSSGFWGVRKPKVNQNEEWSMFARKINAILQRVSLDQLVPLKETREDELNAFVILDDQNLHLPPFCSRDQTPRSLNPLDAS